LKEKPFRLFARPLKCPIPVPAYREPSVAALDDKGFGVFADADAEGRRLRVPKIGPVVRLQCSDAEVGKRELGARLWVFYSGT
jgi:hypothetical protein